VPIPAPAIALCRCVFEHTAARRSSPQVSNGLPCFDSLSPDKDATYLFTFEEGSLTHDRCWRRILLVEDNPSDVKLAMHAFKTHHIANHVHVVRDGAEALEFIFCTGPLRGPQDRERPEDDPPGPQLPLVDGIEVCGRTKADPARAQFPSS